MRIEGTVAIIRMPERHSRFETFRKDIELLPSPWQRVGARMARFSIGLRLIIPFPLLDRFQNRTRHSVLLSIPVICHLRNCPRSSACINDELHRIFKMRRAQVNGQLARENEIKEILSAA
jgi:hypothetical protein